MIKYKNKKKFSDGVDGDKGNGNGNGACAHGDGNESACARDDDGRNESARARDDDGGNESARARDGGRIGIESACALDIHIFYGPPDFSLQPGLVLKIKIK
jgi:hypothetical protein